MALGYFDFLYFWDKGGDICEDYLPCEAGVSKNEARTNVLLEKSSCELANLLFEVEDVIRIVVVGSSVTTLARTKPLLAFSLVHLAHLSANLLEISGVKVPQSQIV